MNMYLIILIAIAVTALVIGITGLALKQENKAKKPLEITGLVAIILAVILVVLFIINKNRR